MDKKSLEFTIFMLYQLADTWHIPPYKVYAILKESGALDQYLVPCYDVLHTLGSQYLVEDITDYVQEKGYQIC